MALLVDTLLDRAIIRANNTMLSRFENRRPEGTTINAFLDYREQTVPADAIEAATVSRRRPVAIPVLKKYAARIGNVRQIDPTPDIVTSAYVNLAWQTKEFSFAIAPSVNADNAISVEMQFAAQIENSLRAAYFTHANSLEKQLITYLAANAWATPPASGIPGTGVDTNAYILDPEEYLIQAPVLMRELNMEGPYQDISNIASVARQRAMATYGKNNSRDMAQFLGDMKYYNSNNIAVDAGFLETHYIASQGTLAVLSNTEFDAENRTPHDTGEYMTYTDPWFGFKWGVRKVAVPQNLAATYGLGLERAVVIRYDFAIDFAALSSYSSVAGESPIIKINTRVPQAA